MSDSQNSKSDIAKREERILNFWQERNIFEKSLQKDAPLGEFVFYDGPPFATGLPHYGHILPGTIKDAIPRFRTMQGYRVERQWGWDTHGLPLENQVEDHLGLETKKDVEEYGIEKFNSVAKDFVLQYADDWKQIIPRTGRWVDMENDYRTMDSEYTESIWWAFGQLDDKDLIYEGFKSMQICPRCETPLSNFEVNQGYHEQKDIAVTVKLPLESEPETSLLVWTTTPWTLPGNMAVGVNPEETYAKVSTPDGGYIVAKEMLGDVFEDTDLEILEQFPGSELVGERYQPPFDYFTAADIEYKENAWQVYAGDFVTLDEGTGLVHLAPAFGADDLTLAEVENIPIVHHVTESGVFTDAVKDFAGMKVKPRDEGDEEHLLADIEILKYLAAEQLLFAKENIRHQYPLCWRCETPLLNYATTSWFVEVSEFKDDLVAENETVNWVPEAIGSNRFGNWLDGARDWAISRERFWGAPLPVWKSADGERVVVLDSLAALKEKTQSNNNFSVLRHGEAEMNLTGEINFSKERENPLTETGQKQAREAAADLGAVDLIFTSPLQRTQETAAIVAEHLDLPESAIITDERLQEFRPGTEFEGESWEDIYHGDFSVAEQFEAARPGGETRLDIKRRTGEFLYEIDEAHSDKNILIVSHKGVLNMLAAAAEGAGRSASIARASENKFISTVGQVRSLPFSRLPHNDDFELDFHRPYIDEVTWEEDGKLMTRIDSVFDCWFESGSMSYASKHYPFADNNFDPEEKAGYPANFVAEGLDQTRGWFYSSLVLGLGLFGKSPYENVIVNGLVMAEDGQKMSKSKGNYPPVDEVLDEQGADALRFFLLNSPLVRGENVALSKEEIDEVVKKLIYRITNTFSFVELYSEPEERAAAREIELTLDDPLDRWVVARTDELIAAVTEGMENYELDKAVKPITTYVRDLSTWYLRRSRNRVRGEASTDRTQALATLLYTLETLAKITAPFMPFLAEDLYQDITAGAAEESVHLETWPEPLGVNAPELVKQMAALRAAASEAHDLRSQAQLKVRQPLTRLTLPADTLAGNEALLEILRDEVNVREVAFATDRETAELDTELTDELEAAGAFRELLRNVQKLRGKHELDPAAEIVLRVSTDPAGKELIEKNRAALNETASVSAVSYEDIADGTEVAENDFSFTVSIETA